MMPVLSYTSKKRKISNRILYGSVLLIILATYFLGYAHLRSNHDFVHNATGFTGDDGRWVNTDTITMGETYWEYPTVKEFLFALYYPLRAIEETCWRLK